jgi:serine protease Do
MFNQSNLQRWATIILLGLLIGLLTTHGIPAIAYRISSAMQRGQSDARVEGLEGRLASLNDTSWAFRLVSDRVKPAVVHIVARVQGSVWDESTRSRREVVKHNHGSGVIVDVRGYVLTNYHVIEASDDILVSLPEFLEPFVSEIQGVDPRRDLALLKITPHEGSPLPTAELGDSRNVKVGDWVLAIGNPFGLDQSVSAGIVSATGRKGIVDNLREQDFIQTDAAINRGNSGGPLVNIQGKVIGITTAVMGSGQQNIGFAVPSRLAIDSIDKLIKHGRIPKGWIGCFFEPVSGDAAEGTAVPQTAVEVAHIVPWSPAQKAGLNRGDVVLRFNGDPVRDVVDLQNRVEDITAPETRVVLSILRGKDERDIPVVIDLHPSRPPLLPGEAEWGIRIQKLTPQFAHDWGYDSTEGILVAKAPLDAQLKAQDIITAVNGDPTPTLRTFCEKLELLPGDASSVDLTIRGQAGTWTVRMPWPGR